MVLPTTRLAVTQENTIDGGMSALANPYQQEGMPNENCRRKENEDLTWCDTGDDGMF